MRWMTGLIGGLALAGCAAGLAGADRADFEGVWNLDRAACDARPSETRLEVRGDTWRFYESVCRRSEAAPGPDAFATVLECRGEGAVWPRQVALRRMGDLLELAEGGQRLVYHRCGG